MDPRIGEYFSIVTVMITVPFAVIGLNLIGSLWQARIRAETPMLFALGVISAMGMGGLGGLYLGTATSDMYFHDSYFVVGHFHLTIGTVTFLALFGGIYHWFPKFIGRKTNELLGKTHFWLTIIPMFAMFLLMHLQGMGGIHRRYYDVTQYSYPNASAMALMPWISYLAFALFAGQLVFAFNVIWSIFRGEKSSENPWGATTLEWTAPSPAPHGNWPDKVPVVHRDPYDYGSDGVWAQNVENAEGQA
jgi:cytochrome c oxidase subunit 1